MEVLELIVGTFFGFFGGFAAILIPSDDPGVHRLQRTCRIILGVGTTAFVTSVGLVYFGFVLRGLSLFIVAYVAFLISGLIGSRIEVRCKAEKDANR